MRGRSTALRIGAPLVLALACRAGALDRHDGGGGVSSIGMASDGGVTSLPGGATSTPGGVGHGAADGGSGSPAADGAPVRTCALGPDGSGLPSAATSPPNVVPTRTPFTCATLPETYIFPPSTLNPPHAYARCASFSVGAATAVSLSPDGRLAVLVTGDGIARVVELRTRQVVAVLASPRGMIDRAAFAPDGGSILTLASKQLEATLWRTGDWTGVTRVWTAELPGRRYDVVYGGGVAFAPDGLSAIVSPGAGVFLLDVASGQLRQRALTGAVILDIAYGLGGSRVVVATASVQAHCNHWPNGGVVALLDGNLQGVTTIADLGSHPGWGMPPSFRVSPTEDLVLTTPGVDEPPGLHAFKLSDGAALPAPGWDALPLAFMPDGTSVLMSAGGALQRVGFPDGQALSVAMLGDDGPLSISGDGTVVAVGGKGSNLLRTWKPDPGGAITYVCNAEDPGPGPASAVASLSADGQTVAVGVGSDLRVFRRADGARLMSLPMGTSLSNARLEISPRGRYVAIAPTRTSPSALYAIPNGARIGSFDADPSGWVDFLFTPAEDKLYVTAQRSEGFTLETFPLASSSEAARRPLPASTTMLGLSGGCPVLYSQALGVWRSCGECDDTPIAGGVSAFYMGAAVLSADGMFVAAAGPVDRQDVSLWRLRPDPAALLAIPGVPTIRGLPRSTPLPSRRARRGSCRAPGSWGPAPAAWGSRSASATARPARRRWSTRCRRASRLSTPRCARSPPTARSSGAPSRSSVRRARARRWAIVPAPCPPLHRLQHRPRARRDVSARSAAATSPRR